MPPSRLALGVLVAAWSSDLAVRAVEDLACEKAQHEAADLTKVALSACASVGAGAGAAPLAAPNPACLLLLCRAQQMGHYLLDGACPDATGDGAAALFDVCPLVPGLLTPDPIVAFDDEVTLDFDRADPMQTSRTETVDVLANDKFTFGQTLRVTSIQATPASGSCAVVNNQVTYTNSFPDYDSGTFYCDYEVCYNGRYDTSTYTLPAAEDLCAVATLAITITGAPTNEPSSRPSSLPSSWPSSMPSVAPDPCDLLLAVAPVRPFPPAGFDPTVRCTKRPSTMTLKFNGGACDQSMNQQDGDKFSCTDYGDGPAGAGTHRVVGPYTEFAADLDVGDTFTLDSVYTDGWFPSNVKIQIYAGNTTETLLQEVYFHSSCSKPLSLSDKFGAVQVFGFTNDEYYEGTVSLNQPFETLVQIENNSTRANVTVDALEFVVNGLGGAQEVSNATLAFGDGLNVTTSDLVDTTGPLVYQASVVAVGDNNVTCAAMVEADFYAVPIVPDNSTNTTAGSARW